MGGQATLCFMDISYDSQKVHQRDPILYDEWIQSSYPYGKWFLTLRSDQFLGSGNEQLLSPDLDLAEERKEVARIRLAQYLQRLQQGFEKGVETRVFIPKDLVLGRVVRSMKNPSQEKLGPNQEGPYQVTSIARTGTYWLEDLEGIIVPRPWNVNNLQKYYYQLEVM